MEGYGSETLHGRGIPFATGVKMANPELTVISVSGDGDSYGIWVGHLIHACRRNIPFVHITCDNQNYALTTGQASCTTPIWAKTKSTPEGNEIAPMHPVNLAEVAGCKFVRSVPDKDIKLSEGDNHGSDQIQWICTYQYSAVLSKLEKMVKIAFCTILL